MTEDAHGTVPEVMHEVVGRRRARLRKAGGPVAVVVVALGLSACGGGSAGSGVAKLGTTTSSNAGTGNSATAHTTGSGGNVQKRALEFSKCMRAHGVTDFPDPENGEFVFNVAGFNPTSPTSKAAQQACRKYIPGGGTLTASSSAKQKAMLLKYAKCMRAHGVTDFPEPTSRPGGAWGFNMTGTALHVTSPTYEAATRACESLRGGGGHPCGGSRRPGVKVRRC